MKQKQNHHHSDDVNNGDDTDADVFLNRYQAWNDVNWLKMCASGDKKTQKLTLIHINFSSDNVKRQQNKHVFTAFSLHSVSIHPLAPRAMLRHPNRRLWFLYFLFMPFFQVFMTHHDFINKKSKQTNRVHCEDV